MVIFHSYVSLPEGKGAHLTHSLIFLDLPYSDYKNASTFSSGQLLGASAPPPKKKPPSHAMSLSENRESALNSYFW